MSPEISRRCRGCGASVRVEARFCPQCGGTMTRERAPAERRPIGEPPASNDATFSPPKELTPDVKINDAASHYRPTVMQRDEPTLFINPHSRERSEPSLVEGAEGIEAPGKRRRPVTVVEENLRPRVEKLREASIMMLDEAPDDSGLRFVLIGVVLFLVFLLFLYITVFTY